MNPVIEQHDNFLMYIKNKFKLLVQQDTIVSLLVDKIHQKPFIDYKGGNIVDLFDDCNESGTSDFAFMLSSIFSQYKDVVHVMPTKWLKTENLFDIVKHMIIGLEEIGFPVLTIITDNNAINKKNYFDLLQSPKGFHCTSTPSYKISNSLLPLRLSIINNRIR